MLRGLIFLLCWLFGVASAAPRTVMLYSHYDYPPFVIPDGEGLNQRLAERMSALSQGRYAFVLQMLPRKRLDQLLATPGWQGVVPWVNPQWFDDVRQQRFLWSAALLHDEDLLLSRPELALEWRGPESLQGLRLGGILGHRYVDVDALVGRGLILREDVPTLEANVRKLMAGRVDAIFVSRSGYFWLAQRFPSLPRDSHLSAVPRSRYDRHLFTSGSDAALNDFVLALPARLARDREWLAVLAQFQLQPAEYQK
ncbi:ABC transporter substrate-binding protein [Chitinilyticum aquatile]|uniref:ABC transporter substrate-binding protein n=1 Tax=Chitinilyticum aquatile TaxID=362520 RepID=UPI0004067339|nr:ABC transporter substrate-binding protein [Chitinilyticum aquatile]